jgi:hypothetical protein
MPLDRRIFLDILSQFGIIVKRRLCQVVAGGFAAIA